MVGNYNVIFSDGHKVISAQSLQAFDPTKVTIKEISDAICHRPGTIIGNGNNFFSSLIDFIEGILMGK